MADLKISQLTAISVLTPATDVLPVVDVGGVTKKITTNQILGSGGTATLASATITGDLTVDTSTLKVDSTNNRVGIGTASPNNTLTVRGTQDAGIEVNSADSNSSRIITAYDPANTRFYINSTSSGSGTVLPLDFLIGNSAQYRIAASGVFSWYDGAGGTRMTLNSTGLGVGVVPSTYKFEVGNGGSDTRAIFNPSNAFSIGVKNGSNQLGGWIGSAGNNILTFSGNDGTMKVTISDPGNVGVGVTPIAWQSGFKEVQVGPGSALGTNGSVDRTDLAANWYYNGGDKYINATGKGSIFSQSAGAFSWLQTNTASGGAGSAMTLTTAMTLDASGNLLVKKTAVSGTTLGCELTATGVISGAAAGLDNLNIYNTTAAAYRFYVSAAGTVFATTTVISAISDSRLKENVQDLDVGLDAVLALKPRKFDWKAGKGKDIKGDRGFIAQEFETVFPNLIDEWKDPAPEGEAPYKSVRQDLIPVLVKAIQELTARVQTLEAR